MAYKEVVDREMEWKVPFKRDEAFPLDRSSIFVDLDEINSYVKASKDNPHPKGVPYVGQIVAVSYVNKETNEEVLDIYKITKTGENGTVSPIIDLGDSLSYDDKNRLNVKIVNNGDNYNALVKDNNGALTVPMVDVKATKITNDIIIKDGPLASIAEKVYTDGKIPANTSVEDFLKSLLCVEIYPDVSANTSNSNYSLTLDDLSITYSNVSKTTEIGTIVPINSVCANIVNIERTNPIVRTFDYGYSNTLNGDKISASSISETWNVNQSDGSIYKLTASKSNFGGDIPASVTATTHSNCILSSCNLVVNLGDNTYTVTEEAPNHVGSHEEIESKYIISNLGNTSEDKKSPSISARTNVVRPCQNKSGSITIKGVYPIFTNCVNSTTNNLVDATNKIVIDNNVFEVAYGPESVVESMDMFAYPASHTLKKVEKWNALSNGGEYQEENILETQISDITKKLGVNDVAYKLWKRLGSPYNDSVKIRFTLDKKTSVE
jgi:hypothetical protein